MASGVKLAGLQYRLFYGTSEVIVVLSNLRGETDTKGSGETMAADRLVVAMKQL